MTQTEFWLKTPFEVYLQVQAWMEQREENFQRDIAIAWHTAALQRSNRLPTLQALLNPMTTRHLNGDEAKRLKARHEQLIKEMV